MVSNCKKRKGNLFPLLFFLFDISPSPLYHDDIRKESESLFFIRQNPHFLLTALAATGPEIAPRNPLYDILTT
jgi:hypothetical protein